MLDLVRRKVWWNSCRSWKSNSRCI